jgi:hypothetical protein
MPLSGTHALLLVLAFCCTFSTYLCCPRLYELCTAAVAAPVNSNLLRRQSGICCQDVWFQAKRLLPGCDVLLVVWRI